MVGGAARIVDLEGDGLALVDTDVRGETLNARVAGTADIPLALGGTRELVLGHDRVHGQQRPIFQGLQAQPGLGGASPGSGPNLEKSFVHYDNSICSVGFAYSEASAQGTRCESRGKRVLPG